MDPQGLPLGDKEALGEREVRPDAETVVEGARDVESLRVSDALPLAVGKRETEGEEEEEALGRLLPLPLPAGLPERDPLELPHEDEEALGEREASPDADTDTEGARDAEPLRVDDAQPLSVGVREADGEEEGEPLGRLLPLPLPAGLPVWEARGLPLGEGDTLGEREASPDADTDTEGARDVEPLRVDDAQPLSVGVREADGEEEGEPLGRLLPLPLPAGLPVWEARGLPLGDGDTLGEREASPDADTDKEGARDVEQLRVDDAQPLSVGVREADGEEEGEPLGRLLPLPLPAGLPVWEARGLPLGDGDTLGEREASPDADTDKEGARDVEPLRVDDAQPLSVGVREADGEEEGEPLGRLLPLPLTVELPERDGDGEAVFKPDARGEALPRPLVLSLEEAEADIVQGFVAPDWLEVEVREIVADVVGELVAEAEAVMVRVWLPLLRGEAVSPVAVAVGEAEKGADDEGAPEALAGAGEGVAESAPLALPACVALGVPVATRETLGLTVNASEGVKAPLPLPEPLAPPVNVGVPPEAEVVSVVEADMESLALALGGAEAADDAEPQPLSTVEIESRAEADPVSTGVTVDDAEAKSEALPPQGDADAPPDEDAPPVANARPEPLGV